MGLLLLFLTTFIWGTAFLAQKYGADNLGPIAFTALRNVLGGAFLLVCIGVRKIRLDPLGRPPRERRSLRTSILAGVLCGLPLFCAMVAQQTGVAYTTPGICAFLTTNYVLFVPLLSALFLRKRPRAHIFLGAALALVGTYFICLPGEAMGTVASTSAPSPSILGIGKGEAWSIACALLFAVQMMVVDHFARSADLLVMSAVQLLTCAVIGVPLAGLLPAEAAKFSLSAVSAAAWPLVYCGVFSSGIAYTLQNVAQSRTSASVAAIVLSMESVFGALSGWVVLHDSLSLGQLSGCALVLAAVILTQLLSLRRSGGGHDL